jgi:DHA2 family multidrug resistance protein
MASSMMNVIQQVGGSIGIAVLGLVLHRRTTHHLSIAGANMSADSAAYHDAFSRLFAYAHGMGLSHAASAKVAATMIGTQIAKVASVHAYQDAFLMGSGIVVLSMVGLYYLPTKPVLGHGGLESAVAE